MAKFSAGQYLALGGDPSYEVIQIVGVYTNAYLPYYSYVEIYNNYNPAKIGNTYTGAISVIDQNYSVTTYPPSGNTGGTTTGGFNFSDWLPMPPNEGPPLPKVWGIYWPWYKG